MGRENEDEDGDCDGGKFTKGKSTVVAVDCKWKNGIKLRNAVSSSRSREINPNLKTIDFDFESKIKFVKEMDQICEEYFPSDNVLVLEANKSHGTCSSKYSQNSTPKESEVELEPPYNHRLPYDKQDRIRAGTTTLDPCDVENIDYNDLEEHKVLLVPTFSKSGFEVDSIAQQRYRFPYKAKFLIGTKRFDKTFELQLPLSTSPQHFGLIFTFPEKQAKTSTKSSGPSPPQKNIVIKSMISVYSVFPHTSRHASLTTYEFPDLEKVGQSGRKTGGSNLKSRPDSQARAIAKDYLATMKDSMNEDKLVARRVTSRGREQFVVNHDFKGRELVKDKFVNPINKFGRQYPTAPDGKHKKKEAIVSGIRVAAYE
jgi:hypothetical protein